MAAALDRAANAVFAVLVLTALGCKPVFVLAYVAIVGVAIFKATPRDTRNKVPDMPHVPPMPTSAETRMPR